MKAECTLEKLLITAVSKLYLDLFKFLLNYSYKVSKSTKIIVVVEQLPVHSIEELPVINSSLSGC